MIARILTLVTEFREFTSSKALSDRYDSSPRSGTSMGVYCRTLAAAFQ